MSKTDPNGNEQNERVLQGVSYLLEWAKHIITLGAALMVLSVTFLKDLTKELLPPISYVVIGCIMAFYAVTLASIWFALKLIRIAARTVLTRAAQIGSGNELNTLQRQLRLTQAMFLLALLLFTCVAVCVLSLWAFSSEKPRPSLKLSTSWCGVSCVPPNAR